MENMLIIRFLPLGEGEGRMERWDCVRIHQATSDRLDPLAFTPARSLARRTGGFWQRQERIPLEGHWPKLLE